MDTAQFFKLCSKVNQQQMRRRINDLFHASKLMTAVISGFCLCYLLGAYGLGYYALNYLHKQFPLVGAIVLERMVFITFGILTVMLMISTAVIGYTTLFKNKETQWLYPHPVSPEILFRWKSMEATLLSSWAFIFLLIPLAIAYGNVYSAPWGYYLCLPFLLGAFVVLCGVFGLGLLFFFLWLARYRSLFTALLAIWSGLGIYLIISVFLKPPQDIDSLKTTNIMNQLLDNTRFLTHPVWPSYWLSRGLLSALDGAWSSVVYFFLLLLSNALFFTMLSYTFLSRSYSTAWNSVYTRTQSLRLLWRPRQFAQGQVKAGSRDLLRLIMRPVMGRPAAALLWKDAKTFFRDPQQWLQFAVFFGIMGVYIINLQKMRIDVQAGFWSNFIAHMNLAACSMTLGTLTTRFVFPQFSLEGRRLWLVGLSPIGLKGVVWQKFWTSVSFSGSIVLTLTLISCFVLALPAWQIAQFTFVIILMTASLSSLSVGLGVIYPNFKEDNPAKIVSGFGGTLCLVLTFIYVVICIACLAVPSQMAITDKYVEIAGESFFTVIRGIGMIIVILISAVTISFPMSLALKKAAKLEL